MFGMAVMLITLLGEKSQQMICTKCPAPWQAPGEATPPSHLLPSVAPSQRSPALLSCQHAFMVFSPHSNPPKSAFFLLPSLTPSV